MVSKRLYLNDDEYAEKLTVACLRDFLGLLGSRTLSDWICWLQPRMRFLMLP